MCSYDSYSFKSNSETLNFTETDHVESINAIKENEFGSFQETYNWIECESMRFPGKTYFFNLRTQNSTWIRPVSKHVRLQRFTRKSKVYDNNCMIDPEIPLMVSSESVKENYDFNENEEDERNNNEIYKNSEILARLYYGASIAQFSNNNKNIQFKDYFNYFVENLYNKDLSNLEDPYHEITEEEEETASSKGIEENSSIVISNFLEVELFTSEDVLNIKENVEPSNEGDTTSITEKSVVYSTSSSDEETKENYICQDYVKPRLGKIKAKYLLKEQPRNGKRRKVVKKRAPLREKKLPEVKIVREMYGTTTVSYDPVEPELPPGVKRTNLSDSSEEETVRPVVLNDSELLNNFSCVANLSSQSSSSTCSSSSSSCSCSCSCSSSSKSSVGSKTSNSVRNVSGRST